MMKPTVHVAPTLIRWAHVRSGQSPAVLEEHFPDLPNWEREGADMTLGSLEEFSRRTYTPIGNFFLDTPPQIDLGIPDFRTRGDRQIAVPSAGLVDTLAITLARQAWYRDYARAQQLDPVTLVESIEPFAPIEETAAILRTFLQFEVDDRTRLTTLETTYRHLAYVLDDIGVLVMKSGIVGSNTHRLLNPDEFGGFALADAEAPLIFINGADTLAAQIFTLCHETVHLAIGQSALVDAIAGNTALDTGYATLERWCNRVAAEILVPQLHLAQVFDRQAELISEVKRLAHMYKSSTIVALRSIHHADLITRSQFQTAYAVLDEEWLQRDVSRTGSSGGDFYRTQTTRLGRRFATAVVLDTLGGRTLYADAYRLLATSRHQTFEAFAHHLGVT